jgi:hypothetical protein
MSAIWSKAQISQLKCRRIASRRGRSKALVAIERHADRGLEMLTIGDVYHDPRGRTA